MIQKTVFKLPPEKREEILSLLKSKKEPTKIGLYYLDITEMEELFLPILEKAFGLKTRFERVWGHFMDRGGERPFHKHSVVTMLYYLEIPPGDCGSFVCPDYKISPKENDLYIFPAKLTHRITPNNTDGTRWAIASECLPESILFKELVKKNS